MAAIALRNLGERKLRTFLTSLAIVLGVMMVAGTYVLTDTIDRSFDKIFTESNEGIDAVVTSTRGRSRPTTASCRRSTPGCSTGSERTDGVAEAAGGIFDPQVAIIGKDGEPLGGGGAPTFGPRSCPSASTRSPTSRAGKPEARRRGRDRQGRRPTPRASRSATRSRSPARRRPRSTRWSASRRSATSTRSAGASIALLTLPEAQRITGKQGSSTRSASPRTTGVDPEQLAASLAAVAARRPSRSRPARRTPSPRRTTSASSSAS